jgi:diguanylate cyclase
LLQKIAPFDGLARSDAAAGEPDHATSIANNALALIRSLQLPATPRVYELCYAYATGEYPTVRIAINDLLNRRVAVGSDMIEEIAAKYVSRRSIQDELDSVGSRVAHEVEQVLVTLDRTNVGPAYDGFIQTSAALSTARHPDALLTDVKELQRASAEIGEEQRKLEAQLNASNAELASLRAQLQKLQSATGSDTVTGLPNRHEFKPLLKQAVGETTAIDAFTGFNESWGYDRGNQVLCLVAMEIRQKVSAVHRLNAN